MPRSHGKARTVGHKRLSFREMCYRMGITPKERIALIRYYKEVNQEPRKEDN